MQRFTTKIPWSEEALRATQVPHKSGNSRHHEKKIGNARHRCFVVLSGRNQTASDDQALDRVVTPRNSVEAQWLALSITLRMSESKPSNTRAKKLESETNS